jgi:hypothetical protein
VRRSIPGLVVLLVVGVYVMFAGGVQVFQPHRSWDHSLYASLAEGFRRGHTYLPQEPDPKLVSLENPYDPDKRTNVPYIWDASYWNGRYYLYFSPVPALFFYMPYRVISGRYPTDAMAAVFFGSLAFVMSVAFIKRALRMRRLWAAWIPVLGLASLTPFLLVDVRIYEVAVLAGAAMSTGWAWALLKFVESPRNGRAIGMTIWLALAIAVRPNLGVLLLVTFAALILARGTRSEIARRIAVASNPLVVVFSALLAYNAVRFHDPFEAGHTYQLTGVEMAGRSVCGIRCIADMWRFANSMVHYVFWPVTFDQGFPFVRAHHFSLDADVSFPGSEEVIGIAPLLPIAMVTTLVGGLLALDKRRHPSAVTQAALWIIAGGWLVIAGLSTCWYVVVRYEADFIQLLLIASVVLADSAISTLTDLNFAAIPLRATVAAMALYSTLAGTLLGFAGRENAFQRLHPGRFATWRGQTVNPPVRLYPRRPALRTFRHEGRLLLPIVGTLSGARWRVDQKIRNTSDRNIPLLLMIGDDDQPIDLRPGQVVPVASGNLLSPYAIFSGEADDIATIEVSTSMEGVTIPTIREADLRTSPLIVSDVPLTSRARLNLRLWVFKTTMPVRYVVTIVANGRELASRSFATRADGFQIDSDLLREYPELAGIETRADLVITIPDAGADARVWGFVTSTDNRSNDVTMHYPR